jgi:hypothetical protein
MWVEVIKADTPSLNNNVYPEAALKAAAELPLCKVYPAYCKAGEDGGFVVDEENNPVVGEVIAWSYDDGWFKAQIVVYCPHFASLLKEGHRVVRAAAVATIVPEDTDPVVRRVILKIDRIDHLAIRHPDETSWTVLSGT